MRPTTFMINDQMHAEKNKTLSLRKVEKSPTLSMVRAWVVGTEKIQPATGNRWLKLEWQSLFQPEWMSCHKGTGVNISRGQG